MASRYPEEYERWREDPEAFWAEAAKDVHWFEPWETVLDRSARPIYRWFVGGKVNTCYNALDVHVQSGRGEQNALIYDSPITGTQKKFTYSEMLERTAHFAGALRRLGVEKGDRVVIYMPMVPEAVVAMLACARLGAVHSVVFGGFAARELATRIDDAKPKVIVSASCGIEPTRIVEYKPLLDGAIELASHRPDCCVVLQREQHRVELGGEREISWEQSLEGVEPAECVPVAATDPLYILYTSGTTGVPKGVVRDNGGHMVALKWSMKHIYDARPGETYWAASDIGWVVGHSYIVYAPLFAGCTTILFEGKPIGTPDAGVFWRVIEEHQVRTMFTAPTAFRAIKREDPAGKFLESYDTSCLRTLFLAGERADPDTIQWLERHTAVPVIDHWWQTETGWPIAANCAGLGLLPVKYGSATVAVPGYDVRVLDEGGQEVEDGESGSIAMRIPLPPGCLPTLWKNDEGYVESYLSTFPGFYSTGDAGFKDGDGYLHIMSRTDDLINVAGHRLSTGAMEEVLSEHPDVAECAVIGVADAMKGEVPLGLVVLSSGVERQDGELGRELVGMVRERIGPVASFKTSVVVQRLPKTRSGKILRSTMRKIADSESYAMPATIDDPAVLDEIGERLETVGYALARAGEGS